MDIEIKELNRDEYAGHRFTVEYVTDRFYDVELLDGGFQLKLTECEPMKNGFSDELFSQWLEEPVAYGAFRGNELLGFVEGSRESWHNLFRISNIYVEKHARGRGIGTRLMERMIEHARENGFFRGVVLETQSCNYPAICMYKKLGFALSRIDIGEYTNNDVDNHEVRIDLMMKF